MSPPPRQEQQTREAIVVAAAELDRRGLTDAGGMICVRLADGRQLATPARVSPSSLAAAQLLCGDLTTAPPLARIALRQRRECDAVLFVTAAHAQALALTGVTIAACLLPRPCVPLGPYLGTGSAAPPRALLEQALVTALLGADAVQLDRFGLLVVAPELADAVALAAGVEHAARVTHAARAAGGHSDLSEHAVGRLGGELASLGLPAPAAVDCTRCNACPNGQLRRQQDDDLSRQIRSAIERHLGH